jgi:hypothetical protein
MAVFRRSQILLIWTNSAGLSCPAFPKSGISHTNDMVINSREVRCHAGCGYEGPRLKMLARSEECRAEPHPRRPNSTAPRVQEEKEMEKRIVYERRRTGSYKAVISRNNTPTTGSGGPRDRLRISALARKLIKLLRFGRSAAPGCGGDDYSYRRACRLQVVPHTRLGPPVREHLRKPSPTLSSVGTEPLPSSQ